MRNEEFVEVSIICTQRNRAFRDTRKAVSISEKRGAEEHTYAGDRRIQVGFGDSGRRVVRAIVRCPSRTEWLIYGSICDRDGGSRERIARAAIHIGLWQFSRAEERRMVALGSISSAAFFERGLLRIAHIAISISRYD